MFRPSTKPAFFKPFRNAAKRSAFCSGEAECRNPMTGDDVCWARTARDHAAVISQYQQQSLVVAFSCSTSILEFRYHEIKSLPRTTGGSATNVRCKSSSNRPDGSSSSVPPGPREVRYCPDRGHDDAFVAIETGPDDAGATPGPKSAMLRHDREGAAPRGPRRARRG